MGGKNDQPDEVTQVSEPWEGIQPFLVGGGSRGIPGSGKGGPIGPIGGTPGILPEAARLYRRGPGFVTPFNPLQTTGQESQLNYATNLPGMLAPYQQAAEFGLSDAMDVESNPYLMSAMDAAARPITQRLTENVLPSIRRGATGVGQPSSSRAGIAEGIASRGALDAIGDITSRMGSEAYGQGLTQQARTMALYPQVLQQGLLPSQLVRDVGAERQSQTRQEQLDPYNRLSAYAGIINPNVNVGGSVTSPSYTGGSPIAGALGGAASLGGLGAALGASGPLGWGLAGLGGLLGAFS